MPTRTYTLASGQGTQPIFVTRGARVTASSAVNVEYTDAENNPSYPSTTWHEWPGSSAGYADVVRSMWVRGTATGGAGTVAVNDQYYDPGPAGQYWQEQEQTLYTRMEDYGFSPSASAAQNTVAAQQALLAGGIVTTTTPGEYSVGALWVPSQTLWKLSPDVTIYRASSTNAPLLKSQYCGYIDKESRFTRASNVATVLDFGHTFEAGDQVYVRNLTDTTFNGLQTITSVVAGVSWTYDNAGSDYSSGSTTKYGYIIPVRRTLALASFTANTDFPTQAATGYTYVADALPDVRVGFVVFVGSVGPVEVVRVDATGWTYAGAVPTDSTVALSYDYDITIEGGTFDGNRANQSQVNGGMELSTFLFGAVNNLSLLGVRHGGSSVRAGQYQACQQVTLRDCEVFDTLVGEQFEGGARRVRISNMRGSSAFRTATAQQTDDFIAFTGTIYDAGSSYNNTVSPYGTLTFDDLRIRDCYSGSCLNGVKIAADDLFTLDNITIDGFTGGMRDPVGSLTAGTLVKVLDDGTGLTGTVVNRLSVRNVAWDTPSSGNGATVDVSTAGTVGQLDCDFAAYTNAAANNGVWIRGSVVVDRLRISGVKMTSMAAGANLLTMAGTARIKQGLIENFDVTFGTSASSNTLLTTVTGNIVNSMTFRSGLVRADVAGRGVMVSSVGQLDEVVFDACHTETANGLSQMLLVNKASLPIDIYAINCAIKSSTHFGDGGANIGTAVVNIHATNCRFTLSGGNNIYQFSSAGATVVNVFSSGTYYSNTAKLFLKTGAVTYSYSEGGVMMCEKALTAVQVKALFGTPITIAAAPGSAKAYVVEKFEVYYDYVATAYTCPATSDLAIRYTGAAGTILSAIETTGFLDQTSDQTRVAGPQSAVATETEILNPTANAALVVHMTTADVTLGDGLVYVRVLARVIDTVLT